MHNFEFGDRTIRLAVVGTLESELFLSSQRKISSSNETTWTPKTLLELVTAASAGRLGPVSSARNAQAQKDLKRYLRQFGRVTTFSWTGSQTVLRGELVHFAPSLQLRHNRHRPRNSRPRSFACAKRPVNVPWPSTFGLGELSVRTMLRKYEFYCRSTKASDPWAYPVAKVCVTHIECTMAATLCTMARPGLCGSVPDLKGRCPLRETVA